MGRRMAQQQADQRRSCDLPDAVERGQQRHEARCLARAEAAGFLHSEVGDAGERQSDQDAAEDEAGHRRPDQRGQDARRLHDVAADQHITQIDVMRDPACEQRTADDRHAEDRPEQINPGRGCQCFAGDHWHERGRDDITESGESIGEREDQLFGSPAAGGDWCGYGRRQRGVVALEDAPGQRGQDRGQAAKRQPCIGRREIERGQCAGDDAREHDADTRSGEDEAAQRRLSGARETGEAPAGGVDQGDGGGHAGQKSQHRPQRRHRAGHRQCQQRGRQQAIADDGGARRPQPIQAGEQRRQCDTNQRAEQIADQVGGCQQAAALEIDRAIRQHHRQHRREREPADSHDGGKRERTRKSDGERLCRLFLPAWYR